MVFSPLIDQLINALRCLPGVGPKSAQRMAFHLLERNRDAGLHLAHALDQALNQVKHCRTCHTLCETEQCSICTNVKRDPSTLCVVEMPADILAIEQTGGYRGLYFVLMGHLSPVDGIGPDKIGINSLMKRIAGQEIQEMILATNPTLEGEATAHYIANLLKDNPIRITRIAHGVPLGGELVDIDGGTLWRAFAGRSSL